MNKQDNVNHPQHYIASNGLEAIDVIEAFTSDLSGFEATHTANALKYLLRWKQKNGLEDLKKARWYISRLIEKLDPDEESKHEAGLFDSESELRNLIKRALALEIYPATKASVDFIYQVMEDAYNRRISYDVRDMKGDIIDFAVSSFSYANYCMERVREMKLVSDDRNDFQKEKIFFETEDDAREALNCMKNIVRDYGRLSVADVAGITDLPISRIDNCYGWETLDGVRINRTTYGDYAIILPKRKEFKEEQ